MISPETPYKVLKYLVKISNKKCLPKNYENDPLILHFIDRNYLIVSKNSKKFCRTNSFEQSFIEEIFPLYQKYDSFIKKNQIENLENHYSVKDFGNLIKIENNKDEILNNEYTFQSILTDYFGSSKHRKINSILSEAIKKILDIDYFPEEGKEQQYLSVLYPKNTTRYIILCENKNRLITPRHDFIEFWYSGGKNTKQLRFIPKPKVPIFYLCDWDFDGLNIYIDIKQKYLPTIMTLIPENFKSLMEKQEEVKNHRSKWKNNNFFQYLSETEKEIVDVLFEKDSIIEEQKIQLNKINLLRNKIS